MHYIVVYTFRFMPKASGFVQQELVFQNKKDAIRAAKALDDHEVVKIVEGFYYFDKVWSNK